MTSSEEDDLDLGNIKDKMMTEFSQSSEANISSSRVVPGDSEFDTDVKSIDDTSLGTSDAESPGLTNTMTSMEEMIDWSDVSKFKLLKSSVFLTHS